jgi:NADH dehydrogenase
MGVEIAYGDLKDPASIEEACRGVKYVVSTANSMMSRRRGDSFNAVDGDGHLGLVRSAQGAGAKHFIYVSVTPNATECVFFDCKRQVEQALRDSTMAWTILQASAFMETFFSKMGGWNFQKGTVRLIGSGQTPTTFVSLRDVAEFAVMATENRAMRDRAILVGGPQAMTPLEAVKVFDEVRGTPLKVKPVPMGLVKFAGFFIRPFSERASMVMSILGKEKPDVIDMEPIVAEFPVKLTSLHEFAERTLGATK